MTKRTMTESDTKAIKVGKIRKIVEETPDQVCHRISDFGQYRAAGESSKYYWARSTGRLCFGGMATTVCKKKYSRRVDSRSCEYFVPEHQPEKKVKRPSKDDIRMMLDQWRAAEALNDGDVIVVRVHAEVTIRVNGVSQILSSIGLNGIDVEDEKDPYLDEVFEEERKELVAILKALGL